MAAFDPTDILLLTIMGIILIIGCTIIWQLNKILEINNRTLRVNADIFLQTARLKREIEKLFTGELKNQLLPDVKEQLLSQIMADCSSAHEVSEK